MTETQPTLQERIEALVSHANELIRQDYARSGYTSEPPTVAAEEGGKKWCRLVCTTHGQRSAFGFVALETFHNVTYGHVTAGDIHKPDGWKRPAKHKRGSVFQADFNNCVGPQGIAYLR